MNQQSSREESKSGNLNRVLMLPADQIGIWASGFCMVHCLLTPIVLSLSAVSAHSLPSEERTHRVLALSIAFVGALALVKGYRNHRTKCVLLLMAIGLAFIFGGAWYGGSSAIACNRNCDHPDWQWVHDRSPQNQSHLLPRLQLQPLRPMRRLICRTGVASRY